jgi:hypothetical protein
MVFGPESERERLRVGIEVNLQGDWSLLCYSSGVIYHLIKLSLALLCVIVL